jgi:hypothetical protein
MVVVAFDTHALVKRLTAAGLPIEQAEAQVDVLVDALSANLRELATKQDLKQGLADLEGRMDARFVETRAEIAGLEGRMDARFVETRAEIAGLEGRMDTWFAGLEGRMDTRFAGLEGRMDTRFAETKTEIVETKAGIAEAKTEIVKWLVGIGLTLAGLLASGVGILVAILLRIH